MATAALELELPTDEPVIRLRRFFDGRIPTFVASLSHVASSSA